MYHIIDNILPQHLYDDLYNVIFEELLCENYKYTEHDKRYGKILSKDYDIYSYLSENVKSYILKQINEESNHNRLYLNEIYVCVDDANFSIPWHEDTHEKYISCVIYCGDQFNGTTFLNENLQEKNVDALHNRLVFFKSKKTIHCVKKQLNKRYTLQFSYSFRET